MSSLASSCVALDDARKFEDHKNWFYDAISHVDLLFASGFDVRVERQRVLDEATVFRFSSHRVITSRRSWRSEL